MACACISLAGCKPLPDPVPTLNPRPRTAVTGWLRVKGTAASEVKARASYQILDQSRFRCLRIDKSRAIGGVYQLGTASVDLPVRKSARGFEVVAYADRFLDQQYWPQKEKCEWSLTLTDFSFVVDGKRYWAPVLRSEGVQKSTVLRCEPGKRPVGKLGFHCIPLASPIPSGKDMFTVMTGGDVAPR